MRPDNVPIWQMCFQSRFSVIIMINRIKAFVLPVLLNWVNLDSPVWSMLFTLDRQNSNQVSENSCAEAVPSTPPYEVVWSE